MIDSFGLVASGSSAVLAVKPRAIEPLAAIARDALVLRDARNAAELDIARSEERDLPRSYRLGFTDPDRDFRKTVVEARRDGSVAQREVSEDGAMILPKARARKIAEQRLAEVWAARECSVSRCRRAHARSRWVISSGLKRMRESGWCG